MKKKFWKITVFFMAVALTVTCFNLESLYVHATGSDGSNNDATYVKDHGVKNTEGTSVQYMDNDRPETLAEGQVWTGKRVVDNGDNTFTIKFEAIGRKYQDNRNGGVWKDPLKEGSTLIISEAIAPNFELVEGSMSEGVTFRNGVVTWTLPSSNVTSDETGQNVQENKASFKVKCIATNAGHYETRHSNVNFRPDGYNHYYYEWETVKSTTTGNVSWNESGKNGLNAITLSSVIINDKLYNNVIIKGNDGAIIVSREDRNGIVHEYVKKNCTNIKNLDGSGVVSVDMYNYFGETDGNNYIKSYDIILEFKDKDGKIIATYRVKGDKEQVEVDNKGGSNQTFNFNEVITHTNPVLKEEFGTSEELSFALNNYGWIDIVQKPDIFTAKKTLDDPTQRVDNTWWIKFSLGKNVEVNFDQDVIATDVTITDEVADARFKYVDNLIVQYKKSTAAEDAWEDLALDSTGSSENYYKIETVKGENEGGTLIFHFAKVTKEGIDVRFQEKANKGVYSGKNASAENPDLDTNDAATVKYVGINGVENTIKLPSPKVFIPNPLYDVTLDKTTTTNDTDWNNRTYTVHLNANAIGQTVIPGQDTPYDIVLVLDQSGSMTNPAYDFVKVPKGTELKETYYYIKTESGIYRAVARDSVNGGYYYKRNEQKVYIDTDKETLYTVNKTTINKSVMLEKVASDFVNKVYENSPDTRIGVIGFANSAEVKTNLTVDDKTLNLLRVGNEKSHDEIINALNLEYTGNTRSDLALQSAKDLLENTDGYEKVQKAKDRKKLVVFLTDGVPTSIGSVYEYELGEAAKEYANEIKKMGATMYSIGIFDSYGYGGGNTAEIDQVYDFMKKVATTENGKPLYYTPNNLEDLLKIFNKISDTIIYHSYVGTVTDIVDSRFELAEGEKERLINEGATVVTNNGITTITWPNQEIRKDGWSADFDIVAKKDFLGGNIVPTNDPDSGIIFDSGTLYFPKPTVNVKTLPLDLKDGEKTYFLGDIINVDELSEELIKLNKSELLLNDAQINELIKNKKLKGVEYSYPGTNDVVGTLNYEIKVVKPTDMSLENHKADKKGEKVEQYQLVMTYLPYDKVTREDMMNEKLPEYVKPTEGNGDATSQSANGNMYVNVVAGEIDLTKFIDKQYTDTEIVNANQSFVFEITKYSATDSNKVVDKFYQTISFSANENKTQKTVKIKNLEKGYYTIREVSNWSWKYDKNSDDSNYEANENTNEKIFIGGMQDEKIFGVESDTKINGKDYSFVAISNFHNVKNSNNIVSDVASAINKFNN